MKAIIMAGGEGSRLRPLTCDRPKPLVPVLNKPIMEYGIELLKKHGIREIGVTLQYLPHAIIEYFGDGSRWGVRLHYFLEESPLGTAGSIKNAEKFLDEPFLVISGDALTDFDLSSILDFHVEKNSFATIVLTAVTNPLEYGIVITDGEKRITKFLEKPGWGEVFSDTVNTGIYVLQPEVLKMIPEQKMYDFSKDLFPRILNNKRALYGYKAKGYWCDVGNIKQYHQAHMDILDGKVNVSIPGKEIYPKVWVGKDTFVSDAAILEGPLFLDEHVRVEADVSLGPYTIIGSNCVLENNASLKRALLWDNIFVGRGAELRGAIVLKRVKIKPYANLFEGVTIGDDSIIEENATIKPDVKVWPNKLVEKGSILTESLVWGTRTTKSIFGREGVSGTVNIDITPEFASRLGVAYATTIQKESQILVGYEGLAAAKMLKDAFISGLLSGGMQVIDIGNSITPISRYAIRSLGVSGGVHIKISNDRATIIFLDKRAANISRGDERKIENYFSREDFRRITSEAIRDKVNFQNINQSYIKSILENVDASKIKSRGLRVLFDYDPMRFGDILPLLIESLGVEAFFYKDSEKNSSYSEFTEAVRYYGADFGVIFDPHGEDLALVDKSGYKTNSHQYEAILALLLMSDNPKAKVVIPFHAPTVLEQLAKKHSAEIIRSKTSPTDWMREALEEEVVKTQGTKTQFTISLDALHAFAVIVNFLAHKQISLEELLEEIPELNYCKKEIPCPWEKKGSVMRKLIEEGQKEKSELLDGIKIYHDNGWALVLPDNEEAICRIYSEGHSMEAAEELASIYIDKVMEYRE